MKVNRLFIMMNIISMVYTTTNIYPCSTVLLKNKKSLLVCRNLDTPVDLPGYLNVNKRGERKESLLLPIPNCHTSSWIAKYGSVTFTAMGRGFSDGGMNEKGLVIEEMSLPDAEYLIDSNHNYLTSPQWIQYQLDNFSTVEEVLANLSSILPLGWAWHFFVADRDGNSATIEFINGKLIIHANTDMPYPCLSNSPYSQSVEYYNNLETESIPNRLAGQSDQDNSLERFAIAAERAKNFKNTKLAESIDYAFNVLSSIAGKEGYAKRSIVYDIKNMAVYFRTDSNVNMFQLFFKDLNFNSNNQYIDLTPGYYGIATTQLEKCTLENELDLLIKLASLLYTIFEPDDEFPNLGADVETYLSRIYDYYITNTFNTTEKNKYYELNKYLEDFYKSYDLPGFVIGIIKDDKIVYAKGFGYRNIEDKKLMTYKSVFHMASISKPFVAMAIMQLHESGKLNIDTPIVTYIPYFKLDDERYKEITARQLLNHTSGLADYHDDSQFEWDKPQFDDGTAERFVRSLKNKKLYKTGENFAYSSIAFDILPVLISKVTGLTFEEYMQKNILQPLEMRNSTFIKSQVPDEIATVPYELETEKYTFNASKFYPYNRKCAASGTLHSNVFDMFNWCSCNMNKGSYKGSQIIDASSFNMLIQPNEKFDWIGIGWFLGEYKDMKRIHHSGSDIGYSLHHTIIPEKSIAVIVLGNSQICPSKDIALAALDIFIGKEPPQMKKPVSIVFSKRIVQEGLDSAINEYHYLKENNENDYDFNPYYLGILAIRQMQQGKVDLSIELLNFLLKEYPDFESIIYYYLGLAHLRKDEKELAILDFNKVIELDPTDIRAMEILDEINTSE